VYQAAVRNFSDPRVTVRELQGFLLDLIIEGLAARSSKKATVEQSVKVMASFSEFASYVKAMLDWPLHYRTLQFGAGDRCYPAAFSKRLNAVLMDFFVVSGVLITEDILAQLLLFVNVKI
jgi:hypothetical protein